MPKLLGLLRWKPTSGERTDGMSDDAGKPNVTWTNLKYLLKSQNLAKGVFTLRPLHAKPDSDCLVTVAVVVEIEHPSGTYTCIQRNPDKEPFGTAECAEALGKLMLQVKAMLVFSDLTERKV